MLFESGLCIFNVFLLRIFVLVQWWFEQIGFCVFMLMCVMFVDVNGFYYGDGLFVEVDLMVWVVGVKVFDFMQVLGGFDMNCVNQIVVGFMLQVIGDECVFVIGDCGSLLFDGYEWLLLLIVQVVMQQVEYFVKYLFVWFDGMLILLFVFYDFGVLVLISDYDVFGMFGQFGFFCGGFIQGCFVQFSYLMFYWWYQQVLYGFFKVILLWIVEWINGWVQLCICLL